MTRIRVRGGSSPYTAENLHVRMNNTAEKLQEVLDGILRAIGDIPWIGEENQTGNGIEFFALNTKLFARTALTPWVRLEGRGNVNYGYLQIGHYEQAPNGEVLQVIDREILVDQLGNAEMNGQIRKVTDDDEFSRDENKKVVGVMIGTILERIWGGYDDRLRIVDGIIVPVHEEQEVETADNGS